MTPTGTGPGGGADAGGRDKRTVRELLEDIARYGMLQVAFVYSFIAAVVCVGSGFLALKVAGIVLGLAVTAFIVWAAAGKTISRQWVLIAVLLVVNTALIATAWQLGVFES